jgi:hypothetical protein
MRALESELDWTFPAIKKQVDALNKANLLQVDKSSQSRSITLSEAIKEMLREVFLYALKHDIAQLMEQYDMMIDTYYHGQLFGNQIEPDLVVIYRAGDTAQVDQIKQDIALVCRQYFIDNVLMTFMSAGEREKRYRLADRFVLSIMREVK